MAHITQVEERSRRKTVRTEPTEGNMMKREKEEKQSIQRPYDIMIFFSLAASHVLLYRDRFLGTFCFLRICTSHMNENKMRTRMTLAMQDDLFMIMREFEVFR